MKKWLFVILAIISVIVISAYWIISNIDINNIVKQQIQTQGLKLTGRKVVVDSVDIKLAQGTGRINNFKILSSQNNKYKNIIILDEIKLDIDISQIVSSVKVINNIEVNGINVFVYMDKNGKVNIAKLEQQIKNKLQNSKPRSIEAKNKIQMVDNRKYDPNIIVKQVALRNIEVHLDFTTLNQKYYKVTLQQIKIYNIGGKNGFPASKIGGIIINELNKKIMSDIVIHQEQIIKEKVEKEIRRELKDRIKNLF